MSARKVELLILDVDGVLTDGRVTLGAQSQGEKAFYVQDGCAIKLWQRCGGKVAILSGRDEDSIRKRAAELGIACVHTGVTDKRRGYASLLEEFQLTDEQVGYVGDDLPDLGPLERCGYAVAVANAVAPVKRAAAFVTGRRGGDGAVAEVVEVLLRLQGKWSGALLSEA